MGEKYSEVVGDYAYYFRRAGVPVRTFGERECVANWVFGILDLLDKHAYLNTEQEVLVVRYCMDEDVRKLVKLYLPVHGGETLLSYLAECTAGTPLC